MILVSDQRLTDARTGTPVTDRANKAIVDLRSKTTFAYTGIASVGPKPTDEWIMDSMAQGDDPTSSLLCLRDSGTHDFEQLELKRSVKRLAVVGAGWARFSSGSGEIEPYLVLISNFDGGNRWLSQADRKFRLRWFHPLRSEGGVGPAQDGKKVGAWTAGQDLSPQRLDRLVRNIKKGLQRTGSLAVVIRLVAEEVRSFADLNPTVGKGLLVTTIPEPGKLQDGGVSSPMPPVNPKGIGDHFESSRLPLDSINFLYVPPDLSAPAASYGPLVIDEGIRSRGIEIWAETPPWWK